MRLAFLFFLSTLFVMPAQAAKKGVKVIYDYEMSSKKSSQTMVGTYLLTDNATRVEIDQSAVGMGGPMVMIQQVKPRKRLVLNPKDKTYTDVTAFFKDSDGKKRSSTEPTFKPTGKTKTVAKHKCEVMTRKHDGATEEVCISRKFAKEFKMLLQAFSGEKNKAQSIPRSLQGFPLEFISRESSGASNTMRVREISRQSFTASAFNVPKGYKAATTPGVPPGKQGALMNDAEEMQGKIKEMMKGGQSPEQREKMKKELEKMAEEMKKKYGQ